MAVHHGCALPSLLPCSVPIHAIHMLGSKSHAIFFSATIIPHYPLYTSPSRFSTFTSPFGPLPELHGNFVLPSLHRAWLWQLCPCTGLSRWSAPFWRLLPYCCGGLKVYYCAQPHLQKTFSSLASWTPPITDHCPLKLWRPWRFLLPLMSFFLSFKTHKPPCVKV